MRHSVGDLFLPLLKPCQRLLPDIAVPMQRHAGLLWFIFRGEQRAEPFCIAFLLQGRFLEIPDEACGVRNRGQHSGKVIGPLVGVGKPAAIGCAAIVLVVGRDQTRLHLCAPTCINFHASSPTLRIRNDDIIGHM